MKLARFPRIRLGHMPTPLEPMKNLSEVLGGPNLWIKRDDCTGLATGGNKTRKLEFLMADALQQGADTVITQGATQSNHARQTVAAAVRLKMHSHIILEDRTRYTDDEYKHSGNVLFNHIMGATMAEVPGGSDMDAAMRQAAGELRSRGRKPYIIPGGGSTPVGALGYVACALELAEQAYGLGLDIHSLVHATGSAGTQAGLVTGMQGARTQIPVLGIGVRAARAPQEERVFNLAQQTCELLGVPGVAREHVVANCDYVGEGYGLPTAGMTEAVALVARTEGIFLDPVYSGKGMAGLIDLIRKGQFKKGQDVVFLHTGGAIALYGYRPAFAGLTPLGN